MSNQNNGVTLVGYYLLAHLILAGVTLFSTLAAQVEQGQPLQLQSIPSLLWRFANLYIDVLGVIAFLIFLGVLALIAFVPPADSELEDGELGDSELEDSEIEDGKRTAMVTKVCGCETAVESDKDGFVESRPLSSEMLPEVWVRTDHGSAWTDRLHLESELRCVQCGKCYTTYSPIDPAESADSEVERKGWKDGPLNDDELFGEDRRVVDATDLLDTEVSAGQSRPTVRRARAGNPQDDLTPVYSSQPSTETGGPFEAASEIEANVS